MLELHIEDTDTPSDSNDYLLPIQKRQIDKKTLKLRVFAIFHPL